MKVARTVADQVLCLPIYPSMTDADIDRVVSAVLAAAAPGRVAPALRLAAPVGPALPVAAAL